MCQVTVIGAIVILLYSSRACYNLVVLGLSNKSINSFDYDWYNVSDQVNHRCIMPERNSLGKCAQKIDTTLIYTVNLKPQPADGLSLA